MSLTGTCGCKDTEYTWPHFATPKAKCIHCDEWVAWTINRIKKDESQTKLEEFE